MLSGVDNRNRSVIFRADVGTRTVRRKRHGAWTPANFESLDQGGSRDIDHRDGSCVFGSDVNKLSVWAQLDALGLFADWNGLGDFAGADVNEAGFGVVFVGDNDGAAVVGEIEILRVGTALDGAHKLVLPNIEDPNTVCSFVGRRKLALVDARASKGRTA